MEALIIKGTEEHLEQCCDMLMDSKLGEVYFSNRSPKGVLSRGFGNGEIYVVVNDDKKCIGFMWWEMNGTFGKYPYLHMLIIHSQYRRQGIGELMIDYFEHVLSRDHGKVFLLVGDFNGDAKRLYERLNYKVVGVLPDFYMAGVTEQLMMKIIV